FVLSSLFALCVRDIRACASSFCAFVLRRLSRPYVSFKIRFSQLDRNSSTRTKTTRAVQNKIERLLWRENAAFEGQNTNRPIAMRKRRQTSCTHTHTNGSAQQSRSQ